MKSKQALENIKDAVEYITRLDYVDPIVRGEVKQILFNAYHNTTPEFNIIERDLDVLNIFQELFDIGIIKLKKLCVLDDIYQFMLLFNDEDKFIITERQYKVIEKWLNND